MKKWLTKYAKLRKSATETGNILSINPGTVVDALEEKVGIYERVMVMLDKPYVGWLESAYLESYNENYAKDCVNIADIQTPDIRDAEQYVFWKNIKQTNMCGELAVCYNLSMSLSFMLERWEQKTPTFFKRIFGSDKAAGTTDADLVKMYGVFGICALRLTGVYTPEYLKPGMIVSCKIDGVTGRLRGQGIGHWVVVEGFVNERVGYGIVQVYNPFPNRIELYEYKTFIESCRNPYGAMMEA